MFHTVCKLKSSICKINKLCSFGENSQGEAYRECAVTTVRFCGQSIMMTTLMGFGKRIRGKYELLVLALILLDPLRLCSSFSPRVLSAYIHGGVKTTVRFVDVLKIGTYSSRTFTRESYGKPTSANCTLLSWALIHRCL